MKTYVLDQFDLFNRTGSFWRVHMAKSEMARVQNLISLNLNNTYFNTLENCVRGTSEGKQLEIGYVHTWENIIVTESLITDTTIIPITNVIAHKVGYSYLIPVKENTRPLVIKSLTGLLYLEKDFDVAQDYIWFKTPLNLLFETNECLIEEAEKITPSFFSHTYQTKSPYQNYDLVVDFAKNKLELLGLEKATAVVAGLPVIRKGGRLLTKVIDSYKTIYTFDSEEILEVYQTHKELIEGQFYLPNTLLKETGLQFYFPKKENPFWYRSVNWDYGLSLDKITTYEGLLVQDLETYAFTAGQDPLSYNGSHVHTRMYIVGYFDIQDSYWNEVARKETLTGQYLNSVIGLDNETTPNYNQIKLTTPAGLEPAIASLPNTKKVNPLDIYFSYILKDKCFVVEIDERLIKNKDEVVNFIYKNSPPNIVPIVRIRKSDLIVIDYAIEKTFNSLFLITDQNGIPLIVS